ncbi:hypothetical protein [Leptolyngbya sp. FACHB-261]|uniref:hypothetical protein n=1 Tax=Leptolyngbya sp. FACHB-261 TaxID=2692806 RepID=UPI001685E1AD|nr:hypothetical protein [Leptolyngbya sp. FACHB-261]MBD2104492.1 hypothetical protein [Leptolyngbya sp. FACHB-261]
MPKNLDNVSFSASDQKAVLEGIDIILQKLSFLLNLSKEEQRNLPKVGDKSRIFIQQAMEVVNQNVEFLPRSFDVENMRREVSLYEGLYPILLSIARLHELVEDTYKVAGCEAYNSARVVYSSAKTNLGAGNAAIVSELKRRYARKTRKPQSDESQA